MKQLFGLLAVILGVALSAQAQSYGKQMSIEGTICQSTCVAQVNGVATCDRSCTDKSGDAVLVGDNGSVMKIAAQDQNMCKSHMGKHVKVMAMPMTPSEQERERTLRIERIFESQVGG